VIAAASANTSLYWYVTRGTGAAALVLLTASIVLGVLTSLGWKLERWPRFATAGLHRDLTLVSIAFVAIHVVTTVLDGYAPIGLQDAVIPFVSPYRPIWLGLGAVAFDLLLALIVTSLLRVRLGYRLWRGLHWLAYAAWPVALIHALGTGTDTHAGWLKAVGVVALTLVAAAVLARAALQRTGASAIRLAAGAAALLAPVAILAWYQTGPAQRGWAKRAGTPSSLIASRQAVSTRVAATPRVPHDIVFPRRPFSASLTRGTITETNGPDTLVTIVISGRLAGGPGGAIRIDLRGLPTETGVAMTASGVSFLPAGAAGAYTGSVTELAGRRVAATVRNASGRRVHLTFALDINADAGTVGGTVAGVAA
jgi:methionine sulfoxide reductase heme-binding subunit